MEDLAWRDSARPIRFYVLDARLLALVTVWIFWPSMTTTLMVFAALAAFRFAESRGFRLKAALRALRARLAGKRRALQSRRSRRFVDFG